MAPQYKVLTGGAVALSAATAKTVLGVKAHANSGLLLQKLRYGFDGIATGKVPVLIEVCYCTWATNAPGTNSTSVTPVQVNGRVLTVGFTAGKTWTTEPTVLTVLDEILVRPDAGWPDWMQYPLGDEYDCALAEGFALRFTAPDAVNVRANLRVARC